MHIDVNSPEGNAFYLLGLARSLGEDVGLSKKEAYDVTLKMKQGDYQNLLRVFAETFGDVVELVRTTDDGETQTFDPKEGWQ